MNKSRGKKRSCHQEAKSEQKRSYCQDVMTCNQIERKIEGEMKRSCRQQDKLHSQGEREGKQCTISHRQDKLYTSRERKLGVVSRPQSCRGVSHDPRQEEVQDEMQRSYSR